MAALRGVRQARSLPSSPRTDERTEIRHGREAVRALRLAEAVVALANKNARILWALMTRGEAGYAPLAWQVGRLHDAFAGKYTTTSLARGVNWL